jgi:hypothetical protein
MAGGCVSDWWFVKKKLVAKRSRAYLRRGRFRKGDRSAPRTPLSHWSIASRAPPYPSAWETKIIRAPRVVARDRRDALQPMPRLAENR